MVIFEHRPRGHISSHMMRLWRTIFLFACIALPFGACTPIYIPTAPPTPLPRGPGDLHIAASVGTHGVDASVAVTVDSQIVVVGSGSRRGGRNEFDHLRHDYAELLAGWYSPYPDGSVLLLAGGGAGRASASCADYPGYSWIGCDNMIRSGDFTRYIIQANVGFRINDSLAPGPSSRPAERPRSIFGVPFRYRQETGFAWRIVLLRFDHLEERTYLFDTVARTPVAGAATTRAATGLFIEPTIFTRWIGSTFGMEGQIGGTLPVVNKGDLPVNYIHLSFGIFLRFERSR
jgi:hypothetical protein